MKTVGRLALREEGPNWNAYYAQKGTMVDALPLGSIRMQIVRNNPQARQGFMDLMISVVAAIIEGAVGMKPTWGDPETAPEHERAGKA